jgi:hypothetical protein
MKSKLSAALVAAACALVLSFGAANADIITLDVAGTMIAESGTASCSPACTLGGSFVLDNSTGHLISSNITMAGESPSVGPFTTSVSTFNQGVGGSGATGLEFIDTPDFSSTNDLLILSITGDLTGFTGGALNASFDLTYAQTPLRAAVWILSSGLLTQAAAAVPGPIAGAGLPGLVMACGGLIGWWRRGQKIA